MVGSLESRILVGKEPWYNLGGEPWYNLGKEPWYNMGKEPCYNLGREPCYNLGRNLGNHISRLPLTFWSRGNCIIRRGHLQLCNRQTILVSLESTGPYQRNGASLIFMRRLVLEIQLFLIHVLQKFSFL